MSPFNDGTELKTAIMPEGVSIEIAPERREEFSPGLDAELLEMNSGHRRAGAVQGR